MKYYISGVFFLVLAVIVFWPTSENVLTIVIGDNVPVENIITSDVLFCKERKKKCLIDALQHGKFSHFFIVDAYQIVRYQSKYPFSSLEADVNYYVLYKRHNVWMHKIPTILSRIGLERCDFEGRLIKCSEHLRFSHLDTVVIDEPSTEKHPELIDLYKGIHLAKAYEELNATSAALGWYKTENTTFYAQYRLAVMDGSIKYDLLWKAHQTNPLRREPLYYLARIERSRNDYAKCILYCQAALSCSYDLLDVSEVYIEFHLYEWAVQEQYAECLYLIGRKDLARHYWNSIVDSPLLPENTKNRIKINLSTT